MRRRVGFALCVKEYLTIHDIYLLARCTKRVKEYLDAKQYLKVYKELKAIAQILTGAKSFLWYHVLRLKTIYNAFGFKQGNSEQKQKDIVKSIEDMICYYSVALNVAPIEFAKLTPIDALPKLHKMVVKHYVEKWRNMMYAHHVPEKFDDYLQDMLNSASALEESEEVVDRIRKAIERSPNINKSAEPHWADAKIFLKHKILQ